MPEFHPPSFVRPVDYSSIPRSIDSLFNAYHEGRIERARLQAAEAQAQAAQTQAQYAPQLAQAQLAGLQQGQQTTEAGFREQNMGLSPQEFNSANASLMTQGSTRQEANSGIASTYAQPQGQPQGGPPGQQEGLQQQQDPRLETARHILQMHQAAQVASAEQQQAGLRKTSAEADVEQARADLISGKGGGGAVDTHIKNILAGNEDPSADFGRGTEGQALRVAIGNKLAQLGVNKTELQAKYDAMQKRFSAQAGIQGGQGQTLGTQAGLLEDLMNQVEPRIKNLSTGQIRIINDAWAKGLHTVNDPNANEALALLNEARGAYSSVLANGNAPGDAEKAMASESIARGLSPEGFSGTKKAVIFAAQSKVRRLLGQGYNEPAATPAPNQKAPLKIGRFSVEVH